MKLKRLTLAISMLGLCTLNYAIAAVESDQNEGTQHESLLGTIQVKAKKDTTKGFVAKRSKTATKTDTPIAELAQSVSVVTHDQIVTQGARTTEEALRYTAGVVTESSGFDQRGDALYIRGFDPVFNFRDGLRVPRSGTYGQWVVEPQGVEQIEVLKGPTSVMYGQASPGGIVNIVSKRPTAAGIHEVSVTAGNFNTYQATADIGGKLNDDGSLLYRVNALIKDNDTQTDHIDGKRFFLAPSFTWLASKDTTLTVLADYTRDRTPRKSWLPSGTILTSSPDRIPVSFDAGDPDFDRYDRDAASLAYILSHRVDDTWSLSQTARYAYQSVDYQQLFGAGFDPKNANLLYRRALVSDEAVKSFTIDNHAQANFKTGPLQHRVLIGVDYQNSTGTNDGVIGSQLYPINVYNPVYGAKVVVPPTTRTYNKQDQLGFYLQDQVRLDNWLFNAGVRHDSASMLSNTNKSAPKQKDNKTTYNAGLLYAFDNGFAPYASYSTSFSPVPGTDFFKSSFVPETAKQVEVGVKYQPKGSNILITASVFDIHKQNAKTDDLVHPNYFIQVGEIRSKGFELEGKATLSQGLDLTASYTYLDNEVTKSNANDLGRKSAELPKNSAKLWLDYSFQDDVLRGLKVGGGARYNGVLTNIYSDAYHRASSTMLDAMVSYKIDKSTIAVNATNITNNITTNQMRFYGLGRVVQATYTYAW